MSRPFPLIFAAPSGAGKTAIVQALLQRREDLEFSVSATTRPKRVYEKDGVHYWFVSEREFREQREAGGYLEWAEVHGNLYGTPASNLRRAAEAGRHLVLDIDIQGARQVRRMVEEAVSIFVLPPSGLELARRLAGRGSEAEEIQRRRLVNARGELQAVTEFDYVVVNESLGGAVEQVESILRAESARVRRIEGLPGAISRLAAQIDHELETRFPNAQI